MRRYQNDWLVPLEIDFLAPIAFPVALQGFEVVLVWNWKYLHHSLDLLWLMKKIAVFFQAMALHDKLVWY